MTQRDMILGDWHIFLLSKSEYAYNVTVVAAYIDRFDLQRHFNSKRKFDAYAF